MKAVDIRGSLKEGWKLFTQRGWYFIGLFLAFVVLFILTAGDSAVVTALSYILYGGYFALLLKHARGERVVFDDLFSIDSRWISFAFLGLIKTVLILIGFLLLIIPGIYLSVRWMFAELLVIDKGLRPLEALKASSELTKGYRWKLFLFSLVMMILILVGFLALGIGAVVASIVSMFAIIKIYFTLSSQETRSIVSAE